MLEKWGSERGATTPSGRRTHGPGLSPPQHPSYPLLQNPVPP